MATTYQAYYRHELNKLLNEEIQRMTDKVTGSYQAINDFADYRYHIGVINGLRKALELCDEAEAVVNGKE
jgi:flagellar motor component MotA